MKPRPVPGFQVELQAQAEQKRADREEGGAEAGETAMGDGIPGGIADTGETEGVTQFSVPGFTGAVSGGKTVRKSEFTSARPTKASAPMPKIGISFFTGDMQPKTFAGRKSSRIEEQKRKPAFNHFGAKLWKNVS